MQNSIHKLFTTLFSVPALVNKLSCIYNLKLQILHLVTVISVYLSQCNFYMTTYMHFCTQMWLGRDFPGFLGHLVNTCLEESLSSSATTRGILM
jgi:hypothetical protein